MMTRCDIILLGLHGKRRLLSVKRCGSCARYQNLYQHRPSFQLFSPLAPFYFVDMACLRPLSMAAKRNQVIVVVTDCSSKLTRAIPALETTCKRIENIFIYQLMIPYYIPLFFLREIRTQLKPKRFAAPCGAFGVKHLTTTPYHPQTNNQDKKLTTKMESRQ